MIGAFQLLQKTMKNAHMSKKPYAIKIKCRKWNVCQNVICKICTHDSWLTSGEVRKKIYLKWRTSMFAYREIERWVISVRKNNSQSHKNQQIDSIFWSLICLLIAINCQCWNKKGVCLFVLLYDIYKCVYAWSRRIYFAYGQFQHYFWAREYFFLSEEKRNVRGTEIERGTPCSNSNSIDLHLITKITGKPNNNNIHANAREKKCQLLLLYWELNQWT